MHNLMAGSVADAEWGPLFGVGAIVYMLVFWVLPVLAAAIYLKKIYNKKRQDDPNSWIVRHGKKGFIILVVAVPASYIIFNVYGFIDYSFEQRRRESYNQCLSDNGLKSGEDDMGVCRKYLKKDWGI